MAMSADEAPLEPGRPIIDPHLHLWHIIPEPGSPMAEQHFLFDEALAMIAESGHNITHTVFVECLAMYRKDGPEEMRAVGETEFANGAAAMAASGNYGPCLLSHRIVGTADLRLGPRVRPVLEAHCAAGGERFRGIRMHVTYSPSDMFGFPGDPAYRDIMQSKEFREGAKVLSDMGLSLDLWPHYSQLSQVAALADQLPDLVIIVDHVGTPDPQNCKPGEEDAARAHWESGIREMAQRSNIVIKLGGLGMHMDKMTGSDRRNANSHVLAEEWGPYMQFCIEAFTPARAMFESNFPPDNDAGSYGATWNALKILSRDYSEQEKDRLFRGTAAQTYGVAIDG